MSKETIRFTTDMTFCDDSEFLNRNQRMLAAPDKPPSLKDEIHMFFRIFQAARKVSILVIRSSWGRWNVDVLAGAILGLLPRRWRPYVVLRGCMWEPDTGLRHLVERLVVKLLDRAVCLYAIQSTEELTVFPKTWHISPKKVRLCLYFYSFTELDLVGLSDQRGDYIFAGGNSHREYGPLIEAARRMPEHRFVFATNRLQGIDLPANMTAAPVSHDEFIGLMYGASAVVVPMRQGMRRAVGQQTYLNAMWLKRPTIISEVLGVHDHVEDKETALIVDGSAEGYVRALHWVFDPNNQEQVNRMCHKGHQVAAEEFTFENYANQLFKIIDEAALDPQCGR